MSNKKPLYVPILRAKAGEFAALLNLSDTTKSKLLPLFDIPRNTSKAKIPKTDLEHISSIVADVSKIWAGRSLMVDATSWSPSSVTSEGEPIMGHIHASLEAVGLKVNPVIGYDRWDNAVYKNALAGIHLKEGRSFVIRLDQEAIDDSLDPEYFGDRLADILLGIARSASECIVLIDIADLSHRSVIDVIERLPGAIKTLQNLGFSRMILAGSSIPATINLAVKNNASEGYLPRKEMIIWQALFASFPTPVFGDYGVRSPHSTNEDVIAPDTNGKIRYTTDRKFLIARGYSLRTKDKGAQHHGLAKKIMDSSHYMGPDFSWGDLQISKCAAGGFSGNSTTWIGIDTNHHIVMVVSEVLEFASNPEIALHE